MRQYKGMMMQTADFDTPEFKKLFWEWFDSLPQKERKKFQEYPSDMAELYFYNKIYSKIVSKEMRV